MDRDGRLDFCATGNWAQVSSHIRQSENKQNSMGLSRAGGGVLAAIKLKGYRWTRC